MIMIQLSEMITERLIVGGVLEVDALAMIFGGVMKAVSGAGSPPGGGAPGGGDGIRRRNLAFEQLAEFMMKYSGRSESFTERFPLDLILSWSDFVPKKLEEISLAEDADFWLQQAEMLFEVDEEE